MNFYYLFFILLFCVNKNLYSQHIVDTGISTDLKTPISYLCNLNELKNLKLSQFDFKKLPKDNFKEKYIIKNNVTTKYSFLYIKNINRSKERVLNASNLKNYRRF